MSEDIIFLTADGREYICLPLPKATPQGALNLLKMNAREVREILWGADDIVLELSDKND